MKTLYVTDLDGTLMRDDKIISNESAAILNRLIDNGIFLIYSTARSLNSAFKILKNISFNLPVIIRNGTILADPQSNKEIEIAWKNIDKYGKINAGVFIGKIQKGYETDYVEIARLFERL